MTTAEITAARAANTATLTTTKTGYNYRIRKSADIVAIITDANGETLDAIAPGTGNHKTALDWAEWRAGAVRAEYPTAAQMVIYCGDSEIAVITITDETTPETSTETAAAIVVPSFDSLSHAAANITLEANNIAEIDRVYIAPLAACLARKVTRGQSLDLAKLAGSSTVAAIVRAAIKEARRDGYAGDITPEDRRASALYLAACIIDRAKEEAEQ